MMRWYADDIPFLLLHLPRAVHDLLHHEDAFLVKKAVETLSPLPHSGACCHHIVTEASPAISIEKTLDPIAQRSAQNIGLLLHDYMGQLPSFDVSAPEARKLVEHWRKIMIEQPERLATAHSSHWHDEKTKAFWREKLVSKNTPPDIVIDAWDDWQRASGIEHLTGQAPQKQAMQQKQWQDLVIRSRLHHETMAILSRG